MYYTNSGTDLYIGDCKVGDRQATPAEILADELEKTIPNKWAQIEAARKLLTVTVQPSGHVFAANPRAAEKMFHKSSTLASADTCSWYEDWGTFITNKVELQEAHVLADQADQALIDSIMGA